VTPAELHRRNPYSWVGDNHNKFLSLFSAELRAHGPPAGGICEVVVNVIHAHPELLGPKGADVVSASGVSDRIRAPCRGPASTSLMRPAALHTSPPGALGPESLSADTLVGQVYTLTAEYTDSISFATALSSVVAQAATLPDSNDVGLVDATASVAQSSMSYWLTPFNQDTTGWNFYDAYGDCFANNVNGDPIWTCLHMGGPPYIPPSPVSLRWSSPRIPQWSFAVYNPQAPVCPKMDWKQFGYADGAGAVGGAVGAWMLGPLAQLGSAVLAAVALSGFDAWFQYGTLLHCLDVNGMPKGPHFWR
jgi:hypothetical protein